MTMKGFGTFNTYIGRALATKHQPHHGTQRGTSKVDNTNILRVVRFLRANGMGGRTDQKKGTRKRRTKIRRTMTMLKKDRRNMT